MLRHCIMQMRHQTYPIDHSIYINSPEWPDHSASHAYEKILGDLDEPRVRISYGPTKSPHGNYMATIEQICIEDYDLFLKIDDDDIYFRNYVADVVSDFELRRWDYSGSSSEVHLNGHRVVADCLQCLGLADEDRELGIPEIMPPTLALSRKAIRAMLEVHDSGGWEDVLWRRHLAKIAGMKMSVRPVSNFIYNIHGRNASTGSWLVP